MADFYTYLWLRADNSPYYVGKGQGNRAHQSHKHHRPPKDISRIVLQHWPDESTALAFEMYQIDFWGREDLGTGCLRNMSDGGERIVNLSEISRAKMSKAKLGKSLSREHRAKLKEKRKGRRPALGMKHSQKSRARISKSLEGNQRKRGKCDSELTRRRKSESHLRRFGLA